LEIAREALKGGGRLIQLRAKKISTAGLVETAAAINDSCKRAGATFIVNDRVDVALAVDADGVHLGQDDLPISEARRLLGKDKIIGISTHSLEEAILAEAQGADYIGFGPVFKTLTKKDALKPRGLNDLRTITDRISIPVVAIGGINVTDLESLFDAGVDGVAMISAIAGCGNISQTTSQITEMIRDCGGG